MKNNQAANKINETKIVFITEGEGFKNKLVNIKNKKPLVRTQYEGTVNVIKEEGLSEAFKKKYKLNINKST